MIYISTGGVKSQSAYATSIHLIEKGISNIELSGGLHDAGMMRKLMELKKYASFHVHNYFPPPDEPFVLNLASLDERTGKVSIEHAKKAIRWAAKLGQNVYSFHAGFLIDPRVEELGRRVQPRALFDRHESLMKFIDRVNYLDEYAQTLGVRILIENNVLSASNYRNFGSNPFLMTSADECIHVMCQTSDNVQLLVDVAHLKVSSFTLGFDPIGFLASCNDWIRAYHLSDNDGTRDSNERVDQGSWFWPYLKSDLDYYTLEVYHLPVSELVQQPDLTFKSIRDCNNETLR